MTSLPDAAAFLAEQWPVFPCNAEKRPVTSNGFKDAVRDPMVARRLFRSQGAALIGVPTGEASDLAVIDLDVKNGGGGLEWLAANEARLPRTRRHRTRSGGLHLLFQYPDGALIRNSAGKVAPGVDIRGEGGYIIAPPSDGYTVADDAMPAPMPTWLVDLLTRREAPTPARPAARGLVHGDGTPWGLKALEGECAKLRDAEHGQKHYTVARTAFTVGGHVASGQLAEGPALSALEQALHDMHARRPCEDFKAARRTLQECFEAGRSAPLSAPPPRAPTVRVEIIPPEAPWPDDAPPHVFAEPMVEPDMAFDAGERPRTTPDMPGQSPDKGRAEAYPTLSLEEIEALQPPPWLIEKLLPEGGFGLLSGPFASLKSFLALDLALCVAYGLPWKGRAVRQGAVLYIAGEGKGGIARRIRAWRAFHGVEDKPAPFRLLPIAASVVDPQEVRRVVATAAAVAEAEQGQPVVLTVVDTLARAMVGADENTALDMGKAVHGIDEIREEAKTATLTVHHLGKDKERGSRGSTALPGAADTEIIVEREGNALTVTVTKQKEDEEGEPIVLEARKVGMDGRDAVEGEASSLVLVGSDQAATGRSTRRLSGDQEMALRILTDALATSGEPNHNGVPGGLPSIPDGWWRERFYDRAKPGADPETKQKAFRRAADALLKANAIGMNRGRVWAL